MQGFIETEEIKAETAILVGLITKNQNERKTNEYLDELQFLAETAGAVTVKRFTQKLDGPSSVTYVGKGKLEEIRAYIEAEEDAEREIGMVIFDDELSAKQLRNIERALGVKILDRTNLILDIFAMRAQTANAKTQVELAQYRYMLPRLQRLWTHLERQGGGSGSGGGKGSVGLRGPGETQLEMDRRIILNRMALLKQRLADIDRQKSTQRKTAAASYVWRWLATPMWANQHLSICWQRPTCLPRTNCLPRSTPPCARSLLTTCHSCWPTP